MGSTTIEFVAMDPDATDNWNFSLSADVGSLATSYSKCGIAPNGISQLGGSSGGSSFEQYTLSGGFQESVYLICKTLTFTTGTDVNGYSSGSFFLSGYGTMSHPTAGASEDLEVCFHYQYDTADDDYYDDDTVDALTSFEVAMIAQTTDGWQFQISGDISPTTTHAFDSSCQANSSFYGYQGDGVNEFSWIDTDQLIFMQAFTVHV